MKFLVGLFFSATTIFLHAQPCDDSKTPIVFIHGFLGGGDNWTSLYQDCLANGYCAKQLKVFDWNTIDRSKMDRNLEKLDSVINFLLQNNNAEKVNIIAHSAGGGLSYQYCADKERAKKIKRYVHIGSGKMKNLIARRIDMLNIFSPDDKVASNAGEIDGAINLSIAGLDHFKIITDGNTARAVINFFAAKTMDDFDINRLKPIETLRYHENLQISGKAISFGDNQPLDKATIEIYAINHTTGMRIGKKADAVFVTNETGDWSGFKAKPFTSYELVLKPNDTSMRTIFYYRDIFIAQSPLVYLRALPKTGMTAMMLGGLPKNNEQTVVGIFSASKAIINGRDSLNVNGYTISTEQLAPASKTAIAFFLYDDGDKQTSLKQHAIFATTPFLNAADVFMNAAETKKGKKMTPAQPIKIVFNDHKFTIPARKSKEGINMVIFE